MNTNQPSPASRRAAKLAAEKTALHYCRPDLSDVCFSIGKTSYALLIRGMVATLAVFVGGTVLQRRLEADPGLRVTVIDLAFWAVVSVLLIHSFVSMMLMKLRSGITVSGKTLFCKGKLYTSDEISRVKCSRWTERIRVYAKGRKIVSFLWDLDNAELFIAWTIKCGIPFEDKRFGR